jgi:tetratricopeptide (TPR) repeat protein
MRSDRYGPFLLSCAPYVRALAVAWLLLPSVTAAVSAQHEAHATLPASFDEPMPLYRAGLGTYGRRITTGSREAQAYFDQGIQLLYAFDPDEAARSFREAWKRDPQCAMCYFGEAWAWGPYLNGDMQSDDAPRAFEAISQAARLAPGHTTQVERAMIDAMRMRYEAEHDPVRRERLDTIYANAMVRVHEAWPSDLDVGTMAAEALMLLEPRRGTWDIASPSVQRIHQLLESLLAQDITHPGACHLYVHATESTTRPGKAEACAAYLGNSIPGASHINHMPSHTYNRIGRWGDAVRANIQAWHSDQKAEIGEGFAIYPSHNLHMLLFAASYDGQGAIAIQAGKDYRKVPGGGEYYHALTLLRFGRFEELLGLPATASTNATFIGFDAFARGYAHLRTGTADSARLYSQRVDSIALVAPLSAAFRGHPTSQLLGITGGILRAELQRFDGDSATAITTLERAVAMEDSLRYDEPEPLNFSARHWLGAALLDAGRAREAEQVYRTELEHHPRNGWSLYGLERAVRAQGRRAEAEDLLRQFEEAWARSDTWIRASRF